MSELVGFGPCWMCKVPFAFDIALVASVWIDPQTNLPPDLGGDVLRARRMPLCPGCCETANVHRRENGLAPLDERDSLGLRTGWYPWTADVV